MLYSILIVADIRVQNQVLIQIAHNAVNARLLTEDKQIKAVLSSLLSYRVSGYEMTDKYKLGIWDGMSSLFNYKKSAFPAGMVYMVKDKLQKLGHQVQIICEPIPEPIGDPKMNIDSFGYTEEYKYQYDAVERLLNLHQMIARIATGGGKSRVAKLATARIGRKTLFVTTRKSLMYQMKRHFEDMGIDVGVVGDNQYNIKPFVTVAMIQTLASRLKTRTVEEEAIRLIEIENKKVKDLLDAKEKILNKQLTARKITLKQKQEELLKYKSTIVGLRQSTQSINKQTIINVEEMRRKSEKTKNDLAEFEFVIAEEAHESGSNEYFEVMKHCVKAYYRLALTATPFMKDDEEANMRLMACSGPIGIVVSEKELIDKGILAKPYFMFINNQRPTGLYPSTTYTRAYDLGIVHNDLRNAEITKWSKWGADKNLPILILVNRVQHGNIIKKNLTNIGLKCNFIQGEDDNDIRKNNLDMLANGDIQVLIGTNILDVGVDVPSIGMVILASGGKAEVQLRQRIGRGLRRKKINNRTFIIDFKDDFNIHLAKHSLTRQAIIQNTPGFSENIVENFDSIM